MTRCGQRHRDERKSVREPMDLILDDVMYQCLVRKKSDVEYFALSYIWGGSQTVQATTANLEDLSTPQAFRERYQQPATLTDAI